MRFHFIVLALFSIGFSACSGSSNSASPGSGSASSAPVVVLSAKAKEAEPDGETREVTERPASGTIHFEGKLEAPLDLNVHVGMGGFELLTKSGPIAPLCLRLGKAGDVTIPLKAGGSGAYDFDALRECARRLKRARAEFEHEPTVVISADKDTQYSLIVRVIDAVRGTETDPLFQEVSFRPPK